MPNYRLRETETRNSGWVEVNSSCLHGLTPLQYFNTANEFLGDLPPGTSFGNGPFREVRLLIDGQVAGTAFPCVTAS